MMYRIRLLGNEDYSVLRALLDRHASTSLFMLGNLQQAGLTYQGQRYQGEFFGAFDGDTLVALVVQYWNGIVHSQGAADAVAAIWQQIQSGLRPVKGFVGRDDLCLRMKQAHDQAEPHTRWSLASSERLYELVLTELQLPALLADPGVQCRLAEATDRDVLIPWMIDYNVEALNAEPGAALRTEVIDSVDAKLAAGLTYLLEIDGVPVATSSFNAMTQPYVQIGGVWTPGTLRSRGYARSVVAGSLQHALNLGYQRSILFTDPDLIPAHKAYESLGYRHIGQFGLYLVA